VFTGEELLCAAAVGDVRKDTLFDVASLTKIATATQALMDIDAGRLKLSDGILSLLPELAERPPLAERLADVTVFKLLTHTSGLIDWYPFYSQTGSFAEVLAIALARYGPVSGMLYSDLNFMLLGKALETLHGVSLERCLAKNLVEPLGLGMMTYHPNLSEDIAPSCYGNPIEEEMCADRGIVFTRWRPHAPTRGQANDGNAWYYFGGVAGSAGIFATAEAYQRLCQYHLRTKSPLLISAQSERAPGRGLGWQVSDLYPKGCGHTGFTGTSIYLSRELDLGIVAFTNRLFFQRHNQNPTNEFRRALHHAVAGCMN
jgi:CubicO group peptidase (beta-lactamase class C family)